MVIQQCLWVLFLVVSLFTFHPSWLLITILAVSLNSANLFGYIRARFLNNSDVADSEDKTSAWNRIALKLQERLTSVFTMTSRRHAGGGYSRGKYTQMDIEGNV